MSLLYRLFAALHRPETEADPFGDRLQRLALGQHPRRRAMRGRHWPSPFRSPA